MQCRCVSTLLSKGFVTATVKLMVAIWPVFHRPGRYFSANLAEAGKRPVFWKSVPEAGNLKINNLLQLRKN